MHCLKMYAWTRRLDTSRAKPFTRFYDHTVSDYGALDARTRRMSCGVATDELARKLPEQQFPTCRGLASYVENFGGLTMSADLLSAMWRRFRAYADMADPARR